MQGQSRGGNAREHTEGRDEARTEDEVVCSAKQVMTSLTRGGRIVRDEHVCLGVYMLVLHDYVMESEGVGYVELLSLGNDMSDLSDLGKERV